MSEPLTMLEREQLRRLDRLRGMRDLKPDENARRGLLQSRFDANPPGPTPPLTGAENRQLTRLCEHERSGVLDPALKSQLVALNFQHLQNYNERQAARRADAQQRALDESARLDSKRLARQQEGTE